MADNQKIIQQGELAKYIVTSNRSDFSLADDDFYIELIYGMLGKKTIIQKSDMLEGLNGQWVMTFDTSDMVGLVTARMVLQVPDTDSGTLIRQEVDSQYIAFVVTSPCPNCICMPSCTDDHDVTYERTEQSDIASAYQQLFVTDIITPETGEPYPDYRAVVTSDGMYVYVHRLPLV